MDVPIQIYVHTKIKQELKLKAIKEGRSMAEVLREAIEKVLGPVDISGPEDEPVVTLKKKPDQASSGREKEVLERSKTPPTTHATAEVKQMDIQEALDKALKMKPGSKKPQPSVAPFRGLEKSCCQGAKPCGHWLWVENDQQWINSLSGRRRDA